MRQLRTLYIALVIVALLLATVAASAAPVRSTLATTQVTAAPSAEPPCGEGRWAVKTVTDPAARLIDMTPRRTTVGALRRLRFPARLHNVPRIRGVETTTYVVRAALIGTMLQGDHDIHLVIADPGRLARTMITEFPKASCTRGASPEARLKMRQARGALMRSCGLPSAVRFKRISGRATVSGVGFFDRPHRQTGVAPNGIELHPVLAFTNAHCQAR
jgi:hypothetical protein